LTENRRRTYARPSNFRKNTHMKSLTTVLVFAGLMFVTPLLAQEEESPSPDLEETPSTTVEAAQESPAPTPSPTTETTATATPATAPEKAATAKTEQSPPEKKASPAASPAAAAPGKKMSPQAALKDSENRWAAAIARHDAATVEAMVATDFIGVNPKGKVQNRRALLNEVKGDKDTYTSNKNEKLDVQMYGPGVAVVVGTYREKGTGKDGKNFDRSYRFTDTWMDRGGKWQCIASQVSLVGQK
jgi:ketosteroid isomerase-like protein